jgi:hypothetical protein
MYSKESKLFMMATAMSLLVLYFYLSTHQKSYYKKIVSFVSTYRNSLLMFLFIIGLSIYYNYSKLENFIDFEYNILSSSDLKDTITEIELDAVNDLNQLSVEKTININQEYTVSKNVNLNGRLRSMIPLVKSKLLSVPAIINTVAATYAYQSIKDNPTLIKQLIKENYRTYFIKIANNVFDKSFALLIPNSPTKNDNLVDVETGGLNEEETSIEIQKIIAKEEEEYKDQFNKIYFKKLLEEVRETKYTSPDEITIYDAIPAISPSKELIQHYNVMSNFVTQMFNNQDISFNLNNFGRYKEIVDAVKTYNENIDNSTGKTQQIVYNLNSPNLDNIDYNNSSIFSSLLSPLYTVIRNLIKQIPVNDNTQKKIVHLTKLSIKLENTIGDYDNMLNYGSFKNQRIEIMNDESFQKYVIFLFYNDDNNINFRNASIRLFTKPLEYANSLKRLEDLKHKANNRASDANNTKLSTKTGIINKELNLPVGYFKIGIKLANKIEPLYLTVTSKYKSSSLDHLNQYRIELRNNTSDTNLLQLFYCDIDGRIYNVDKKLCLTVIPASGDTKKLDENDELILAYPDEISKPIQTFKFSPNFDRINIVKQENIVTDYYLTYNNNDNKIVLNEFTDDSRQNKWFSKLIGEYKDQRSVFGKNASDLTRNARQPLDISTGTIPPYNTYTYSFWMQVNKENLDSTSTKLPNAVFIKGNIDTSNNKGENDVKYYRSPGVLLKYSPDKSHYNLIVRLSTDVNLNEEFVINKPDILKTTNDQTVWDHVELVITSKQLKVYLNGNEEYNVNTVGTTIPNPYSLKITPGGGFGGKLHFMRYYNYARSTTEVRNDMYETSPSDLLFGNVPIRELISDDKFLPPSDYEHYGPNSARLHSSYGWNPKISNFFDMNSLAGTFYIQANFDGEYYKIEKMHIQGHGEKNAFIKKFKLAYYEHADGDWKFFRNEEILTGVSSSLEFNTLQNLGFITNKVRVYPIEWYMDETNASEKHRVGLRMGFYGKPHKPNRCDRMVSVCSVDKMREGDKSDRADVGSRLSTATARLSIYENKQDKLQSEIDRLNTELKKTTMKNGLCKNNSKCYPDTLTLSSTCKNPVYTVSSPAVAPKTLLQDKVNDLSDYQLKSDIKYGALCDHLMRVAPNRYDNQKQCIEKIKERVKK